MALSTETPVKSSGNADGGFVKKLKEFDGIAMSIGNGNGDSAAHESTHGQSDRFLSIRSSSHMITIQCEHILVQLILILYHLMTKPSL